MLTTELKSATKHNHQRVEVKLVKQIKCIRNKADYISLLQSFYAYFGGLELSIEKYIDLNWLPDYHTRRKSSLLKADLLEAGAKPIGLSGTSGLPEIMDNFQAIGALYVMEGSTLGGQHIARMIRQQLNSFSISNFSFFDGYGDQTQKMWEIFKERLDGLVLTTEQELTITQTANETFARMDDWFEST